MENEPRTRCAECGEEMEPRPGKKFCSESCKNRYHNRISYERRRKKERTVNALYRNYTVLESLLEEGCVSMKIPELEARGFNPRYVSAYRKERGKFVLNCCFDICYYQTPTRIFGIRRD